MVHFGLDTGLMATLLSVLSYFTMKTSAAALPTGGSSALEAGDSNNTWYHLQSFVVHEKYHKTKPSFVYFTGGDAYLTKSKTDAAKFWIWGGQLGVGNEFVHLDFSNGYAVVKLDDRPSSGNYNFLQGQDGWLHVQGQGISYGEGGQAVFCQSEDGSLFLQGNGKPPFACQDIGLSLRQRAGPAPRSLPPRQNKAGDKPQYSAIPTVTAALTPRSVPAWFAHRVEAARVSATPFATPFTTTPFAHPPVPTSRRQGDFPPPAPTQAATTTRPSAPDPSSDNDQPDNEGTDPNEQKRSFEFDMDGDIVD
ncbi:uncharacterized protein Z520_06544 [Fonsecaea multimorphosa CBS 102226]|uniref:DUF7908 domain-containing protein n=1 Tax=Fonsecaea multimorphosa CBS 102226 TaxID=1442371 RepID=A0A0D2IL67_9EURO|nr:uncharacterized protein Z520_06544 [Fonsecaea multimorphosa CBS 102226]KIX97766.1 hypothetical protein Z520_06544 [Fonsecaea multimorphosa CBS 102226]OAL23786.1 hypothetical protein AYO22_06105 [Fonsecaea multimorphosa]